MQQARDGFMKLLTLTNILSKLQRPDRPPSNQESQGLTIAIIYGLAARQHMQRHLLRFLREAGYSNTTLYGHLQANTIANDLQAAANKGDNIVVMGFSQGGFEAVRVAHALNQRGIKLLLLVTIAAGGYGSVFMPHRWKDNPRSIPPNVERCLNYFSVTDALGTDRQFKKNFAHATVDQQQVENIFFTKEENIPHIALTKCYPASSVHPRVKADFLQRIKAELAAVVN